MHSAIRWIRRAGAKGRQLPASHVDKQAVVISTAVQGIQRVVLAIEISTRSAGQVSDADGVTIYPQSTRDVATITMNGAPDPTYVAQAMQTLEDYSLDTPASVLARSVATELEGRLPATYRLHGPFPMTSMGFVFRTSDSVADFIARLTSDRGLV